MPANAEGAILVIRLSAMGDIIHTLPAAASLKQSFPERKLVWLVAPRWKPLLEGNPYIDEVVEFDRGGIGALRRSWKRLREIHAETVFDFQGLVQSALIGRAMRSGALYGFHRAVAREPLASFFYTHRVPVVGPHRVQRNVQLAAAAGALVLTHEAWIPAGSDEGNLPAGSFVLTNPFAGWTGKEWPLECYESLGQRLQKEGLELVANVPGGRTAGVRKLRHVHVHCSTLPGLIAATRRATAVIGLDSGPLHLAAALHKPGVGLFGPTDPALTGPFGGSMSVIRTGEVETTYKRHSKIHASMLAITMEQVAEALLQSLASAAKSPGALVSRS